MPRNQSSSLKLNCQNFSKGIDIFHVFTVKLYVTLNLKLKCKASLARRLLEDIDFTAFLYICIKTYYKVLVRGIIAGQTLDLCCVLVLSNVFKIHLASVAMNNTRSKWACIELWGFVLLESKNPPYCGTESP